MRKPETLALLPCTQLHRSLHQGLLAKVPLFGKIESVYREDFLLELWVCMRPRLYGAYVPIAEYGVGHTELFVISYGTGERARFLTRSRGLQCWVRACRTLTPWLI